MIGENIKNYRKQKGYSQETLALQLNVVRQTVSKWEKGLSVPDAEMLEKLAEVLEVSPGELLSKTSSPDAAGEKTEPAEEPNTSEIANQLAILKENLAMQARNRKRALQLIKKILLGLLIGLAVIILLVTLASKLLTFQKAAEEARLTTTKITCTVDGVVQSYTILSDGNQTILSAEGSPWFDETFQADGYYGHAGEYTVAIHDYCLENNIPCEMEEIDHP